MAKIKVDINEYASSQSPKVKKWLTKINKLMIDCGCRVDSSVVSNNKRTDGKFSYISRKSKKTVCIINMGTSGNFISLRGNHFIHPNNTVSDNILNELPKNVFNFVIKGAGCKLGNCLNHDYSINENHKCVHNHAEVFIYKNVKSHKCLYYGYNFNLDETMEYKILTQWIKYELAWSSDIVHEEIKL